MTQETPPRADSEPYRIRIAKDMAEIPAAHWDALVEVGNPFMRHAFLHTLEASGCVGPESGWVPAHVLAFRGAELVGAVASYVKNNSYGEYIFDWEWANGAYRAGINYYPKVVSAAPFTPATGRRLLVADGEDEREVIAALVNGLGHLAEACRASSIHLLFLTEHEQQILAEDHPFFPRLTYQYHWQNESWADFDAFLGALRSPARKQIRKERRLARELDLDIRTLRGEALTERHCNAMRQFYRRTIRDYGAIPYLKRGFFDALRGSLAPWTRIEWAERAGEPVAGALYFQDGANLYGRYWGSLEDNEMLHFELCYYRPIERALAEGLGRFEAGAQGRHKLKRGLLPRPTFSSHWVRSPQLSRAVRDFVAREAESHTAEMDALTAHGPFPRGDG